MAIVKLLGQRWVSKHGANPSREWQRLLAPVAHHSPELMAARLVQRLTPNARGEVWPPEMADVIVMLQPKAEDFGLPTVDQAYRDAAHLRWSRHPVVYETARRVGVHEVRTEARSRPAFEREFAEVCGEWMAGKRFESPRRDPSEQLPMHRKRKLTAEEARARIEDLRRAIGPIPAPPHADAPPAPLNDQEVADLSDLAARYRRAS